MKVKSLLVLLLSGIFLASGCAGSGPVTLSVPSVIAGEVSNPKLALGSHYELEGFTVNLSAPSYSLPLDLSQAVNAEEIDSNFHLSEGQTQLLQSNGFSIIPWHGDDIVEPYKTMKERGVPIFVTSDTLLHLYHIQFNEILKRIEEEEFFDQLTDMSQAMLERSIEDYHSFGNAALKQAARRNVAYFAVALELLQTPTEGYTGEELRKVEYTVPDWVKADVGTELENIEAHEGFAPSAVFNANAGCDCLDGCCYCEDYSQYVPRGHYTRSEALSRYFKSMMWYGRMAFLLKGGDDNECRWLEAPLTTEEDAKLATIQAALISAHLPNVDANGSTASDIWNRIYAVTAFFVGTADDLTPYEYLQAIESVFGTEFEARELADEGNLFELKLELAQMRGPEIYGGSGVCVAIIEWWQDPIATVNEAMLDECLDKTKGMRFMGQRFIPDSYMFQNLVSPAIGMYTGAQDPFTMCLTGMGPARCFPRGLDVMAVLGSERAYAILEQEGDTQYKGANTSYDIQLDKLKAEFDSFNVSDWNRNLYWAWLYALKPLLQEFEDGYPTFMQTQAWQNRELHAALASWAELRHDTILYAKQSYTPTMGTTSVNGHPQPKPVVGYVEPVPEFYSRMLALTTMTREGLADLGALTQDEGARLESLEGILERLLQISKDELENKELTEDDYAFIRNMGQNLESVVTGVEDKGIKTTMVADVHTDTNTMTVLEEGLGYVDLILVAYKVPDGRIIIGAGPTMSYYEFKHPMSDRLTDEAWIDMLESGDAPDRPDWTDSFRAE